MSSHTHTRVQPVLVASLAVLIALTVAGGVAVGAGSGSLDDDATTAGVGPPVGALDDPDNESNDTQQVDPDDAGENGDSDAVAENLANSLASRLDQGQISISEGEYDRARSLFGDEYDEELGMYAEVTGGPESSERERTAEEFREARDKQRTLANQTQEYEETYQEYQEARRNGNEDRARELARELQEQAEEINETATDLNRSYSNLSESAETDLATAQREVTKTRGNVTERVSEVEREAFVATRLAVTVDRSAISFSEPARITGTLTTENGTPVANRTVDVRIGGQTLTAATDATGQFEVRYRPVQVQTGEVNLSVAYRPRNASQYLGASDLVQADVSQEIPTVNAEVNASAVTFGDRLGVTGTVTVDGVPARAVPLDVYVGNQWVGRVTTGPDGEFAVAEEIPLSIPDGDSEVRVAVALEGGALASVNGTVPFTVEPTATAVSVSATRVSTGENSTNEFEVTGSARAADGRPLANQTVVLTLGQNVRTTVRTDENGTFATRLSVPPSAVPENGSASATLRAELRTEGTSLLASDATTDVELIGPEASTDDSFLPVPLFPTVLGLGGIGLLGIAFAVRSLRGDGERRADESDGTPVDPPSESADVSTENLSLSSFDPDAAGTETTVRVAYATLRKQMATELAIPTTGTHWEFYAACRDADVEPATLEAVERVVALYERVMFAPNGVSPDDADEAIDAAARAVGRHRADGEATPDEQSPVPDTA